jgi:uncharacterized membrane protein YeiH
MPENVIRHETLLLLLDLGGTFVFAISGAAAGVRSRFDIFGVLVLSFVAGNAGGITRDLLIGAAPPAALADLRYLEVSLLAGVVTFFWSRNVEKLRTPVLLFDAAGLALFAVAGTHKSLAFGINPATAALLGMVSGIGGGMMRDILQGQVPIVLRADLYAVAALAAATVVVVGYIAHLPATACALVGAALCFFLRFMAIRYGWQLPTANPHPHDEDEPER